MATTIEDSPLYYDLLDVLANCDSKAQVYWKVLVHLNEEGDVYEPFNVTNVSVRRDYSVGYGDEFTCTLLIPYGEYVNTIYPNREHLHITLMRTPLADGTSVADADQDVETEQYAAVLIENRSTVTQLQGDEVKDVEALNLAGFNETHFQLFPKGMEILRTKLTGGIFRACTVQQVIESVLTQEVKNLNIDNKQAIKGIDMIDASNQNKYEQIVVPHGIKVIDLPGFLHKKYGVYNAGIGSYIQNNIWYVFPLFDTTRFKNNVKTITIFMLPERKFPELEKTYRVLGDSIAILVLTKNDFRGNNTQSYLNSGNGVRFTDANNIMEGFNETVGTKTSVKRTGNNTEFATYLIKDGVNYLPVAEEKITANNYVQYSKLAMRQGGLLTMNWLNSNPALIEPGMTIRLVYYVNDDMEEAYGTVLGAMHMSVKVGDLNTTKHFNASRLTIFANYKKSS